MIFILLKFVIPTSGKGARASNRERAGRRELEFALSRLLHKLQ
jgi:hypothetical protein